MSVLDAPLVLSLDNVGLSDRPITNLPKLTLRVSP